MMKHFLRKICTLTCVMMLSATVVCADEPAKVDAKSKNTTTQKAKKTDGATKKQKKIDINSAAVEEIAAIDGLDKAIANKIVENRPYTNKSQLTSRKIISDVQYEKIKDSIIAKKPKDNEAGKTTKKK